MLITLLSQHFFNNLPSARTNQQRPFVQFALPAIFYYCVTLFVSSHNKRGKMECRAIRSANFIDIPKNTIINACEVLLQNARTATTLDVNTKESSTCAKRGCLPHSIRNICNGFAKLDNITAIER